jgi:hypothetical protein
MLEHFIFFIEFCCFGTWPVFTNFVSTRVLLVLAGVGGERRHQSVRAAGMFII